MARSPQPAPHEGKNNNRVHEPRLMQLSDDLIHKAQQAHDFHAALTRKLSAAETIIDVVKGQLVSKNKECDNLREQLALQAQQYEYLQELVADAHVEKQILHESATVLQTECDGARSDLGSKSEECNRLQEVTAKLRVGNQLLVVSASRLQREREAARVDLESSRQENTQLRDTISRLQADAEIHASRIAEIHRRLADRKAKAKAKAKVKPRQATLRQVLEIRKCLLSMTKCISSLENGQAHEGTRNDPIELDG
ncbi:hypothetical protein PMIN06_001790 [Paraphaeosphaeria minitans]